MAYPTVDIVVSEAKMAEIGRLMAGVKNGVERVVVRAINKVGVAARTKIVREIIREVNLKSRQVRDRNVSLRKANYRRLEARIRISGRRIVLARWAARQTRKGVTYAIRRGGGRQLVAGAFLATMPSGHRGAFARKPKDAGDRRVGRLPIVELRGPSVPVVMANIGQLSAATLDRELSEKLEGEIDTQLGLVLARRGASGSR